jgi:hypothetical protein
MSFRGALACSGCRASSRIFFFSGKNEFLKFDGQLELRRQKTAKKTLSAMDIRLAPQD